MSIPAERLARIALREVRTPLARDVLRATASTNQAIPDTTETPLKFDTVTYQSDLFVTTSKTNVTLRKPFVGRVTVMATFAVNAVGIRIGNVYLVRGNQTTEIGRSGPEQGDGTYLQSVTVLVPSYDFQMDDQLYATVIQTSGGNLDVVANAYSPVVCIEEIRRRVIR